MEQMKRIRLQKSAESAQSADRFLALGTLDQEQHSRGRLLAVETGCKGHLRGPAQPDARHLGKAPGCGM